MSTLYSQFDSAQGKLRIGVVCDEKNRGKAQYDDLGGATVGGDGDGFVEPTRRCDMGASVTATAKVLVPIAKAVSSRIAQLRAERSAAHEPYQIRTDLVDQQLQVTLDRLRGGSVDLPWWRYLLSEIEQEYVAPKFFDTLSVQSWLGEKDVQEGLFSLTRACLMDQLLDGEAETRNLLSAIYSQHTGEPESSADVPITIVVAVLTAGYIASIPKSQRSLAGLVQAVHSEVQGINKALTSNPAVLSTLTGVAEDELSEILALRTFDVDDAIERVKRLWQRVDGGDLAAVHEPVRNRVRYWAARLLASTFDASDEARSIRLGLSNQNTRENLHAVDALIIAADGDADGAFQMLRDDADSDGRSVLLDLLARLRGDEAALEWCADLRPSERPAHFTAIGWRKWAMCLGRVGRWTEAADGLRAVASASSDWGPELAMIEGVINAALLIPQEYRTSVFFGFPAYKGVAPNLGSEAKPRHARARECLEHVVQNLPNTASTRLSDSLADWRTWVELMDPVTARADHARSETRKRLARGDSGARLVLLAWAFKIEFDPTELRTQLNKHKRLGGLRDEQRFVEFLLNQTSMSAREFASYVEGQIDRLDQVMSTPWATVTLFDALLDDGQVERAKAMLEKRRHDVDERLAARMDTALAAHEGTDPREHLEQLYEESDDLADLKNLIGYLETVEDRATVLPLLRELFNRESNLEHAYRLVHSLSHPYPDDGAILDFLESHPMVTEESLEMKSALAWSLFRVGRIAESRTVNDVLVQLAGRHNKDDLLLDVNIAIATGDWERLPAVVDREWPHRSDLEAEMLMILARVASQIGPSTERSLELARMAAKKAPTDPHVLTAAYHIHFELGRDADADPGWVSQALANATAEKGPIWETDLQEMVNVWLPRMRERRESIDRMLMGGEVPLTLASRVLNTPLSRILLAEHGTNMRDGRRRPLIPIVSAARHGIALEEGWTVGMDLTSIMVLSRVGLLETAVHALDQIKLSPDAMFSLFENRAAVRFHQPTRVYSARNLRKLIDQGRIKLVGRSKRPSADLAEEVGEELATLLDMCKADGGVVVCSKPIHKAKSLTKEVADTTMYDDFILSPVDLCLSLHRAGHTDANQNEQARAFLSSQGETASEGKPQLSLSGPIFVDSLALSYLQSARILAAIAEIGLDLRIHHRVQDEMNAVLNDNDAGEDLAEVLESIRDTLRVGMESGKVRLLAWSPEHTQEPDALGAVDSLMGLLHGSSECDALCVDDRFINAHARSEGPTGEQVPVVCVLDILRHLRAIQVISDEEYWSARHKLRQAGFAFVPVDEDEVLRHLLASGVKSGQVLESVELRVIRQTVSRVGTLELLTRDEARALDDEMIFTCAQVTQRIWSDPDTKAGDAGALCNWVWRHLGMSTLRFQGAHEAEGRVLDYREGVARRLGLMMLSPIVNSRDRRSAYREWLERSVLMRLWPANDDTVDLVATAVRASIRKLGDRGRVEAALFFECLPDGLRERAVNADPAFAEDCGFRSTHFLLVGESLRVAQADLLDAARTVYAGAETSPLKDVNGKNAMLACTSEDEPLALLWTDAEGETRTVPIPDLTLVGGNAEARTRVLKKIVGQLGPTAREIRSLLEQTPHRQLTAEEVSAVFSEETTGVAAIQSRLVGEISQGQASVGDLVPLCRRYWERFCGPIPDGPDAESYFRKQLIPYRKELIGTDLRAGLDICCLGALRDDLNPGAWLEGIDDDTVWEALESTPVQGNPIALLAVLDVALFRVEDERFRQLADDTIGRLLDDHLGLPPTCDVYRFLELLTDFELDQLSAVEGAYRCPGFWRRMCAWMQAGLIARTATACHTVPEVAEFEEWCQRLAIPGGTLRRLLDCQAEPLLFGHRRAPGSLRREVLARIGDIKKRHEKAGRRLPRTEEIESALSSIVVVGSGLPLTVPGPAALHIRPTKQTPIGVADAVDEAWTANDQTTAFALSAHVSQLFVPRDSDLVRLRKAVESIAEEAEVNDIAGVANQLNAASIVAAAAKDTVLADSIGAAVCNLTDSMSRPADVNALVFVLLVAAAAHAEDGEWGKWLATHLDQVAERLPAEASEIAPCLWSGLDSMEVAPPNSPLGSPTCEANCGRGVRGCGVGVRKRWLPLHRDCDHWQNSAWYLPKYWAKR